MLSVDAVFGSDGGVEDDNIDFGVVVLCCIVFLCSLIPGNSLGGFFMLYDKTTELCITCV